MDKDFEVGKYCKDCYYYKYLSVCFACHYAIDNNKLRACKPSQCKKMKKFKKTDKKAGEQTKKNQNDGIKRIFIPKENFILKGGRKDERKT